MLYIYIYIFRTFRTNLTKHFAFHQDFWKWVNFPRGKWQGGIHLFEGRDPLLLLQFLWFVFWEEDHPNMYTPETNMSPWKGTILTGNTVDGRNPAPVDRWFVPLFTGFYTSQLVKDFFHQQYIFPTIDFQGKTPSVFRGAFFSIPWDPNHLDGGSVFCVRVAFRSSVKFSGG